MTEAATISTRIGRIEIELHSVWPSGEFQPLDIKTHARWNTIDVRRTWYNAPYFAIRNLPSSLILVLLPTAFTVAWMVLLGGNWL